MLCFLEGDLKFLLSGYQRFRFKFPVIIPPEFSPLPDMRHNIISTRRLRALSPIGVPVGHQDVCMATDRSDLQRWTG